MDRLKKIAYLYYFIFITLMSFVWFLDNGLSGEYWLYFTAFSLSFFIAFTLPVKLGFFEYYQFNKKLSNFKIIYLAILLLVCVLLFVDPMKNLNVVGKGGKYIIVYLMSFLVFLEKRN